MNFSYRRTFMKVIANRRNAKMDVVAAIALPLILALEVFCFLGNLIAREPWYVVVTLMACMLYIAWQVVSTYTDLAKKYIDFDGMRP